MTLFVPLIVLHVDVTTLSALLQPSFYIFRRNVIFQASSMIRWYSRVYQDNDPVVEDSAVTAAAVALHDDDGDDDDDDDADDDDGESRQKRRKQSREEPAHAPTADDDEDDAISSPGHPPVLQLSARAPPRRCSRSHPLQPEIGYHDWSIIRSENFVVRQSL